MSEFGEPKPEQGKETAVERMSEVMKASLEVLKEEYDVLALDRELQMTEGEYLKMVDIKNRIPSLDEYEEGTLSEEVILAQLFLSMIVSESLGEMEAYYTEHGNKWNEMTS